MSNLNTQKLVRFFDGASFVAILLNVILVPLFIDKGVFNSYIIPKQYLFIGLVLLNIFLFSAKVVLTKRLDYKHSTLDFFLLTFLLVSLILIQSIRPRSGEWHWIR